MDFIRMSGLDAPYFKQAFALYEHSFPLHEQRPLSNWSKVISNSAFHCDALVENQQLIGILFHWDCDDYRYIEHFSICPSFRGQSMGSRALSAFCAYGSTVILEIDPPIDTISERRQEFYMRLGFKTNDFAHLHPAYRKEFSPHPLLVMTYPHKISGALYEQFNSYLAQEIMSGNL